MRVAFDNTSRIKTENAHQYNIGDNRPGQVDGEHAQEYEAVGEDHVDVDSREGEEDEGGGGEQREAADEGVGVRHAQPQALRQRRPQRHAQRAGEHAHQAELVRHAVPPSQHLLRLIRIT